MSPKDGAAAPNKDTGRMAVRIAEAEAASRAGGLTDIAGTSVNIDMGGASAWGFDHPINKNEISRRLALQVRQLRQHFWAISQGCLSSARSHARHVTCFA